MCKFPFAVLSMSQYNRNNMSGPLLDPKPSRNNRNWITKQQESHLCSLFLDSHPNRRQSSTTNHHGHHQSNISTQNNHSSTTNTARNMMCSIKIIRILILLILALVFCHEASHNHDTDHNGKTQKNLAPSGEKTVATYLWWVEAVKDAVNSGAWRRWWCWGCECCCCHGGCWCWRRGLCLIRHYEFFVCLFVCSKGCG